MLLNKHHRILSFIEQYQATEGGVSPSCQEIADAVGFASKGWISQSLVDLEAAGKIRRLKGRRRNIEVLRGGKQPPFPGAIPIYDAKTNAIRGWLP
jgi:SOS-response transcriptional repressor LexA